MGDIGKHIKADMDRMEAEITRLETALAVERARVKAIVAITEEAPAPINQLDRICSLLTAPALAVVPALVHKKNFKQTSVFSPVDDRAYIWRSSECDQPEYKKVTAVILAKEGE